jgi:hypothetical protein
MRSITQLTAVTVAVAFSWVLCSALRAAGSDAPPPAEPKAATRPSLPFKSPQAREAAALYARSLKDAEQAYRTAVAAARKKYTADLSQAMTAATKAGNLDEALAIRAEKERAEQLPDGSAAPATAVDASNPHAADQLIIWNQFNGSGDRGTDSVNVKLMLRGRVVWTKRDVKVPWVPREDTSLSIDLPQVRFDAVRVEIVTWHKLGGGLSEIQVVRDGKNVALNVEPKVSAFYDERYPPKALTDGVTTSAEPNHGYWLLPNTSAGWAEISVAPR